MAKTGSHHRPALIHTGAVGGGGEQSALMSSLEAQATPMLERCWHGILYGGAPAVLGPDARNEGWAIPRGVGIRRRGLSSRRRSIGGPVSPIYDVVIEDVFIFDGTGAPGSGVSSMSSVVASQHLGVSPQAEVRTVVDATGLHVALGVVDLYTHHDAKIVWNPYCILSRWAFTSVAIASAASGSHRSSRTSSSARQWCAVVRGR